MYLLIPINSVICFVFSFKFTFHNVSINSRVTPNFCYVTLDLHSIMYLLIPFAVLISVRIDAEFTFHNVSINSRGTVEQ